jgi:uncharacterized phage protein (TIGR01671 family)
MREIKFRAYDTNSNRNSSLGRMEYFTLKEALCGDLYDERFGCDLDEYHQVMEYTGKKDKNGVPIYEGDVVKENGLLRVIEYGYCEVDTDGCTGDYAYGFNLFHDCTNVEVIGNKFENPELLTNQS